MGVVAAAALEEQEVVRRGKLKFPIVCTSRCTVRSWTFLGSAQTGVVTCHQRGIFFASVTQSRCFVCWLDLGFGGSEGRTSYL